MQHYKKNLKIKLAPVFKPRPAANNGMIDTIVSQEPGASMLKSNGILKVGLD